MKNLFDIIKRKKKTALVLGSGAARGLAHIGVLKALIEKDVPIDMIVGSSMGALVGACYARVGNISELEKVALETDWMRLVQLVDMDLGVMSKGFIQGKKVKELLKTITGDIDFSDLDMPLAVVSTDAYTGREVVIKKGPVLDAVRASISIPGIFTPVKIGKRYLMDGGIVNPVPINVARDMGAGFVIACNVIPPPEKRMPPKPKKKKPPAKSLEDILKEAVPHKDSIFSVFNDQINALISENSGKLAMFQKYMDSLKKKVPAVFREIDQDAPGIFEVLMSAIYTMEYEIARSRLNEADIVISPDVSGISIFEFQRGREVIDKGYAAAKEKL